MKFKLLAVIAALSLSGCAVQQPAKSVVTTPPVQESKTVLLDRCSVSVIEKKKIIPYGVGRVILTGNSFSAFRDNDDFEYASGEMQQTADGDYASARGGIMFFYAVKKKYFLMNAEKINSAMIWDCSESK